MGESPVPVGIEVNCNNYERNMVIKASIPEELLNEIEEKYLKELRKSGLKIF